MNCTVRRKEDFTPGRWPGGLTTELFLHPRQASYAARNFAVRASTSTVETDTSIFTDLPGYRRLIMPLNGNIHLVHELPREVTLAPFEVEVFGGGWHTRSFGRCVDFNLMLAEGWHGKLQAVRLAGGYACAENGFTGLYSLANRLTVAVTADKELFRAELNQGDLLLVEGNGMLEIAPSPGSDPLAVLFHASPVQG